MKKLQSTPREPECPHSVLIVREANYLIGGRDVHTPRIGKSWRKPLLILLCLFFTFSAQAEWRWPWQKEKKQLKTIVESFDLQGDLKEKTAVFDLSLKLSLSLDEPELRLLGGDVSLFDLPQSEYFEIVKKGEIFILKVKKAGKTSLKLRFASKVTKTPAISTSSFQLVTAAIRPMTLTLEPQAKLYLGNAVSTGKTANAEGAQQIKAFLTSGGDTNISWRKEAVEVEQKLTAMSSVYIKADVSVGALKMNHQVDYRIVQGEMKELNIECPADLNILKVDGKNIRDWNIVKINDKRAMLQVRLANPVKKNYQLSISSERPLAELPQNFSLPVLQVKNVLRANGFLRLNTRSSLRLQVKDISGLSQIDQQALPKNMRSTPSKKKTSFSYSFADSVYQLKLHAETVVPAVWAQSQYNYNLQENTLRIDGLIDLDIRDAGIDEASFILPEKVAVTDVKGRSVVSYDLIETTKQKLLKVYFSRSLLGRHSLRLQLESQIAGQKKLSLPKIVLQGTKSERGSLLIGAEKGLQVAMAKTAELRRVPLSSVPVRVAQAQSAWRYKDMKWSANLSIEHKEAAVYSELFHLFSLGDNVAYGSVSLTYHISGAPIDKLYLDFPKTYKNLEVTGLHSPRLYKEGDKWEVRLQEKVMGDYTLLITFDFGGELKDGQLAIGGLKTLKTESETGFISVTGAAGMKLEALEKSEALVKIEADQLPTSYRLLHNSRILEVYKYAQTPHAAKLQVKSYQKASLLSLVVEHSDLESTVNKNGELISKAQYWVKNSSHQYLPLILPKDSRLWSVTVDGKKVRSTFKKNELLIPLQRHKDPNQPIHIIVNYAEKSTALAKGKAFSLMAPKLKTPSVYTDWTLNMPKGFSLDKFKGAFLPYNQKATVQHHDSLDQMGMFFKKLMRRGIFPLGAFLSFVGIALGTLSWARQLWRPFLITVAVLLTLIGSIMLIGSLAQANFPTEQQVTIPGQIFEFRQTVNQAETPLVVEAKVIESTIFKQQLSAKQYIFFGIAGLLMIVALWRRHGAAMALSLLAAYWGCRHHPTAEFAFGTVLLCGLGLACLIAVLRFIWSRRLIPEVVTTSLIPMLLLSSLILSPVAVAEKMAATSPVIVPPPVVVKTAMIDSANYELHAHDKKMTATVKLKFTATEKDQLFQILDSGMVLRKAIYDQKKLELITKDQGYYLKALEKGKFVTTLQIAGNISLRAKRYSFAMMMIDSLQHKVDLYLHSSDSKLKIHQAVYQKVTPTSDGLKAEILFGSHRQIACSWQAKVRQLQKEEVKVFAETQSLALFSEGAVELEHKMNLRIAQGELKELEVDVPKGQTVTALSIWKLHNWGFDAKKSKLRIVLSQPLSGSVSLFIKTQQKSAQLPYACQLELPVLRNCARQRGTLALSARDNLKIRPVKWQGLQKIDPSDFPLNEFSLKRYLPTEQRLLFPYRYIKLPILLTAKAERIKAELETFNKSTLSIGDERLLLNAQLQLKIQKAGIFSLDVNLPKGYDIETVSNSNISHWDENKGILSVYFQRRIKGTQNLQLVLVKSNQGQKSIVVPKVSIVGALKQKGQLVISAERGHRLDVAKNKGLGAVQLRENGLMKARILQRDWSLSLTREVLKPRLEVDSLQVCRLTDKLVRIKQYFNCKIDHAGMKLFELKLPKGVKSIDIRGEGIARIDKQKDGLYFLELKKKAQSNYRFSVTYQLFHQDNKSTLEAVQMPQAIRQNSYAAIFAPSHLDTSVKVGNGEVERGEARLLPAHLQYEDLSNAVSFFHISHGRYSLDVQTVKHQLAETLAAEIQKITLTSVMANNGSHLTQVHVDLAAGTKRFLQMKLPKDSQMVSVHINDNPVSPVRQNGRFLIPLPQSLEQDSKLNLHILYLGQQQNGDDQQKWQGPQFDLPLKDLNWYLYLPKNKKYDKFTGTMTHLAGSHYSWYSTDKYVDNNRKQIGINISQTNKLLQESKSYSQKGQRQKAIKQLESALNYSNGLNDLNEDARVQLQSTLEQNAIVGLYKRRGLLRNNVPDNSSIWSEKEEVAFNDGLFTDDFARSIEKKMGQKDQSILNLCAQKIITQQRAAKQVSIPLKLTLPEEGQRLHFYRKIQIEPMSEMEVGMTYKQTKLELKKSNKSDFLFPVLALIIGFLCMGPGRKKWLY